MFRKWIAIASFAHFLSAAALGDVSTLRLPANTVVPAASVGDLIVPEAEPEISMEAETVEIVETQHGEFNVSCTFRMRSHAIEDLTRTVAFPLADRGSLYSVSRAFGLDVDGEAPTRVLQDNTKDLSLEETIRWETDYANLKYAGFMTWPVTWRPGELKIIKCTYNTGELEEYWGMGKGWRLRYIVRTGALWRGNIGRADIRVTFQVDPRTKGPGVLKYQDVALNSDALFRISYPDKATWTSKNKIHWHFEEWEPTEDIFIEKVAWHGLGESYGFGGFPDPYFGAEKPYSEELLDELARSEIEPWLSMFPRETSLLDRGRLKAIIAEHLYREIYARHGDPFLSGTMTQAEIEEDPLKFQKLKTVSEDIYFFEDQQIYYGYSKWYEFFRPWLLVGEMYEDGYDREILTEADRKHIEEAKKVWWYQPNPTKKERVAPEEFNEIEVKNLKFLKRYFDPDGSGDATRG